jgi:hypothetical protein
LSDDEFAELFGVPMPGWTQAKRQAALRTMAAMVRALKGQPTSMATVSADEVVDWWLSPTPPNSEE